MEGYAELRAGFLKCHESETNVLLHVFTGLLGAAGTLGFVRASSKCFTLVTVAVLLYAVALLSSSAPLPAVVVVVASLVVLVVPLVKVAHLGESSESPTCFSRGG